MGTSKPKVETTKKKEDVVVLTKVDPRPNNVIEILNVLRAMT